MTSPAAIPSDAELRFARRVSNAKACAKLDPGLIVSETALVGSKWFDYRFMTPLEATELFAQEYAEAFRNSWRRTQDYREAELKRALPKDGLKAKGELTSMWRARQIADAVGMKYDVFLITVMHFFEVRSYRRPPRPNQIYGEKIREPLISVALREWSKRQEEAGLYTYSTSPAYKNEVFLGLPAQLDHREFVLRAIRKSHSYADAIAKLHFKLRLIPLEIVEAKFDAGHVDEARRLASSTSSSPTIRLSAEQLRPGCFGLPRASEAGDADCVRCPMKLECQQDCDVVRDMVAKKFGTENPYESRRRKQNRERVSRHRAKKRLAAGAI